MGKYLKKNNAFIHINYKDYIVIEKIHQ